MNQTSVLQKLQCSKTLLSKVQASRIMTPQVIINGTLRLHYITCYSCHTQQLYFVLSPHDCCFCNILLSHIINSASERCFAESPPFFCFLSILSFFSLAPFSLVFLFLLHIIKLPPLSKIARGGRNGLSLRGRHHGPSSSIELAISIV